MKCKCPRCGGEINPASLLGKGKKKTMTPEAIEQRSKAAKSRWAKVKKDKKTQAKGGTRPVRQPAKGGE